MSYSRFLNSHWYTYWHVSDTYTLDTQLFDICGVKLFTYKELKDDIEDCLNKIRELDPKATEKKIQELKGYMQNFMSDVEIDDNISFYENLQKGVIEDIKNKRWPDLRETLKFSEWVSGIHEEDLKKEVDEALKVLYANKNDLSLLVGEMKTNLGKTLLEKRFKGTIDQINNANRVFQFQHENTVNSQGAVAQLGERERGTLEVAGSIPVSSKN